MAGERQSGGKTVGGGFGCGAHETRFSPPKTVLIGKVETVSGARVDAPPAAIASTLRPVAAHRLPPPDWHPKGERRSRVSSALSRASVSGPLEPPLKGQDPAESGGIIACPWVLTFGLLG
jgi:hypothetical protein